MIVCLYIIAVNVTESYNNNKNNCLRKKNKWPVFLEHFFLLHYCI